MFYFYTSVHSRVKDSWIYWGERKLRLDIHSKYDLLYGWRHKRERWCKSRAVIGYPRDQDGAISPAQDCPLPAHHYSQ